MASAPSELADGSARARWAISAILAAAVVLGWIVVRAYRDPALPFLAPHGGAAWVVPRLDMPLRSFAEPLPPTEFVVRFRVATLGPRPVLRLRRQRATSLPMR